MNKSLLTKLLLTFFISFFISFLYFKYKKQVSIIETKNNEIRLLEDKLDILNDNYNEMYFERYYAKYEKYNAEIKYDSLLFYLYDIKDKIDDLRGRFLKLKKDTADLKKYIRIITKQQSIIQQRDTVTWEIPWDVLYEYSDDNYDEYEGVTYLKTYCDDNVMTMNLQKTEIKKHSSIVNIHWKVIRFDDGVKVYITSSHPAFKLKENDGIFIEYPTKKRKKINNIID